MILYKYYGASAGEAAIKENTLGFRTPDKFNDPFELSSLSSSIGPESKLDTLDYVIQHLSESVGILSLTRSYDNPLMWAHYGEEHKGIVVGYDVSGNFFRNTRDNIISADDGEVLYSNTKLKYVLNPETMLNLKPLYREQNRPDDFRGDPDSVSLARKIFLTKHASWVYEEEVRIVRLKSGNGDFTLVDGVEGLMLFKDKAPIKCVYLGVRNAKSAQEFRESNPQLTDDVEVKKMKMNKDNWGLCYSDE